MVRQESNSQPPVLQLNTQPTEPPVHYQLENHRKKLFSPDLHREIFCCITSCDYNSKTRLGHVTSSESKMAERGANVSHCTDFVSFHLYSLLYWSSFSLSLKVAPYSFLTARELVSKSRDGASFKKSTCKSRATSTTASNSHWSNFSNHPCSYPMC